MMTVEQVTAVISVETLQALASGGLFDTRNGSVEVFFDNEGRIRKIERKYVSYKD
jgi:hypothetical protein